MELGDIIIPQEQLKNLQFKDVIYKLVSLEVLKHEKDCCKFIEWLQEKAKSFVDKGIVSKGGSFRNNEIGIDIQNRFLMELQEGGKFKIQQSGKGYPDYIVTLDSDVDLYLECKSYEHDDSISMSKEEDTLRSFYLSPSIKDSVKRKGYHLVIGFGFRRDDSLNEYEITKCSIIDSYLLTDLKLKYEFNTNNQHVYSRDKIYTYAKS